MLRLRGLVLMSHYDQHKMYIYGSIYEFVCQGLLRIVLYFEFIIQCKMVVVGVCSVLHGVRIRACK
jgi:hypothetical protein